MDPTPRPRPRTPSGHGILFSPRWRPYTRAPVHDSSHSDAASQTLIILSSPSSPSSPSSHHLSATISPKGMKRSSGQRPPSRQVTTDMPSPSCRVRVVWDEENLHELETTKSPKQKITEPKTPYHASDDGGLSPTPDDERLQMDPALHAEAVRHALSEVSTDDRASSSRSSGSGSGSSWHYSEDELDAMEADGGSDGSHSGTFEEHRRKHYDNEFKRAKILLATDPMLAVDDDDAAANGEAECSSAAVAK